MFDYRFFLIVLYICITRITHLVCNEKNVDPPTIQTQKYFPLEVGNTWTYVSEDTLLGLPFQWDVTYRAGDAVILNRQFPSGSHGGKITMIDHGNEIDILLSSQKAFPFYRFNIGEMWTHRDTWECDDSSSWATVKEPNTIVTPAGTFSNCIRIERRSAAVCADAGTTFEWWAPGVGLVKWDELNSYVGGPLTIYLKSYKIH